MIRHYSVDLETWGKGANAVITSVAIVNIDNQEDSLYINLEVESQIEMGRSITPSTIDWWFTQPRDVYESTRENPKHPYRVAETVFTLLGGERDPEDWNSLVKRVDKEVFLWGNPSCFDNSMLRHFMEMYLGVGGYPIFYRNDRCLKTLKDAAILATSRNKVEAVERSSTNTMAHNALADAIHQGNVIRGLLNLIGDKS